jgi:hypothetical protein
MLLKEPESWQIFPEYNKHFHYEWMYVNMYMTLVRPA